MLSEESDSRRFVRSICMGNPSSNRPGQNGIVAMIRFMIVVAVLGMTSPSVGQDWEIPAWFQESGHIQGWNSPFNLLWEIPPPYEEGLAVRPIVERPFVLGDFGGARTALSKSGWLTGSHRSSGRKPADHRCDCDHSRGGVHPGSSPIHHGPVGNSIPPMGLLLFCVRSNSRLPRWYL